MTGTAPPVVEVVKPSFDVVVSVLHRPIFCRARPSLPLMRYDPLAATPLYARIARHLYL